MLQTHLKTDIYNKYCLINNSLLNWLYTYIISTLSRVSINDVRTSDRALAIAMVTPLSKVKRHFRLFLAVFTCLCLKLNTAPPLDEH